ncbi:hypothetical protein SLEP1_g44135 [Rubroshorea leprosula]|uniref:Uncharacterized protein n=1 Tax=Rubroshorea leprosula TaxID=152421 RepID=A0AAV5LFT1_9ROSI|nr:hypothetical protein SLEP1_g44135 [Rubroshorea leprosula]
MGSSPDHPLHCLPKRLLCCRKIPKANPENVSFFIFKPLLHSPKSSLLNQPFNTSDGG